MKENARYVSNTDEVSSSKWITKKLFQMVVGYTCGHRPWFDPSLSLKLWAAQVQVPKFPVRDFCPLVAGTTSPWAQASPLTARRLFCVGRTEPWPPGLWWWLTRVPEPIIRTPWSIKGFSLQCKCTHWETIQGIQINLMYIWQIICTVNYLLTNTKQNKYTI